MSEPLDDLHAAAEVLRAARSNLDTALLEKQVRAITRIRAAEIATDILDAAQLLEEAQVAATAAQAEESRRLFAAMPVRIPPPESQMWSLEQLAAWQADQPQPTPEQWEEVVRLMQGEVTSAPYAKAKVAYKAVLFFVRAYQDALYRAFLEARGERAGQKSTMNAALAVDKPLNRLFARDLPEYVEWFPRWRRKRNRIKDGASMAFTGVGGFGLLFQDVTEEGGLVGGLAQTPFSIPDVVEAVTMSAVAAERIASYARGAGTHANA